MISTWWLWSGCDVRLMVRTPLPRQRRGCRLIYYESCSHILSELSLDVRTTGSGSDIRVAYGWSGEHLDNQLIQCIGMTVS